MRREPALRRAIGLLQERGIPVEAAPTTGPDTASGMVCNAIDRGADLILAAGGDGTINEVVNGMAGSNVPLGILPAGTANVLATELGVAKAIERAAACLGDCIEERIALGRLSRPDSAPRYFLLMAGVGLDADIIYRLHAGMKGMLGKGAYWISGFSRLGRKLPEFTVEAEGREFHASFALASRVRNYGGDLEIARRASLLENEFELVLFEGESSFRFLIYMLAVVAGRHQNMRGVTILRARQAAFRCPEDSRIHVQVDGEYAGRLPSRVDIVPNALTLLVPPTFRARRPTPDAAWTTSPTR